MAHQRPPELAGETRVWRGGGTVRRLFWGTSITIDSSGGNGCWLWVDRPATGYNGGRFSLLLPPTSDPRLVDWVSLLRVSVYSVVLGESGYWEATLFVARQAKQPKGIFLRAG